MQTPANAQAFTRDARNILTALGLYADLLHVPGVLSERHGHYARELRLLADRSCSLLDRVLAPTEASGAGADALVERPDTVLADSRRCQEPLCDAAAVLQRLLPSLQEQTAGAAGVVLRLPAGEMPPWPLSGEALERIAARLVCNAAVAPDAPGPAAFGKTSKAGALRTVWLGLVARDGSARLTVEDSGPARCGGAAASVGRAGTRVSCPGMDGEEGRHRTAHDAQDLLALVARTAGRLAMRPRPAGGTAMTVLWTLSSPRLYPVYTCDAAYPAEEAPVAC